MGTNDTDYIHKTGFYEKIVKRFLDILISGVALIILSPILLITALLVAVKLGRPVIFHQDRPGLNEKIFRLYKFRSMTDEKDENGNLLPDEIRLTRFGKILRSTSLDELPELWNIFKGDMSIIGPRAGLPREVELYPEEALDRLQVPQGLSGEWQVNGRSDTTFENMIKMDLDYIEHKQGVRHDIGLILKTFLVVIKGNGAE